MKHTKITLTLFTTIACAAFFSLPPAQAQTQAQMNQSAAKDADKADAAMNVVYKKLMAKLNLTDKAKLKKAQRAWLVFRDADADSLASQETGGTMFPGIYSTYFQEITEARTKELKTALTGL